MDIHTSDQTITISKMLSKHLRHKPHALGLTLEPGGWVLVDTLLAAFERKGFVLDWATLEHVVEHNDKQRFAFDPTHSKIRASQGHSVPIDLQLEPIEPPVVLYHGTATDRVQSILSSGLEKMSRHHVHLSSEIHTANAVGSRYGKPVILQVAAQEMYQAGHPFYCSDNGVWLADGVPLEFLSVLGGLDGAK
jgi:putative RNA 2'-phosphotransferase